jgi:hypothetical protein
LGHYEKPTPKLFTILLLEIHFLNIRSLKKDVALLITTMHKQAGCCFVAGSFVRPVKTGLMRFKKSMMNV